MGRTARAALTVVVCLVVGWLGLFGFVWSRNRVPALALPPRPGPPAANAYPEYEECVRSVKQANLLFEEGVFGRPLAPAKAAEVLRENAPLLAKVRQLVERPSVVTELEPGVNFVARRDFPNVTRLLRYAAKSERDPGAALRALVDALAFTEGTCRGGALLHLKTAYQCLLPLAGAFGPAIARADAAACTENAQRVKALLDSSTPLLEFMQNQRRVFLRIVSSTVPPPGRIARRLLYLDDYDWDYLMKPKTAPLEALNRYLLRWEAEAKKPATEVVPPEQPAELEGLISDERLDPGEIRRHFAWHHYRIARLRLVYAALRLEEVRKRTGRYPDTLESLGLGDYATDPFSNSPLRYRRTGAGYALYSVGANGKDDGGTAPPGGELNQGDILL